MFRHAPAPLLTVIAITLAACSDPTGPRPTPATSTRSASALRLGAQGGKAGASSNPVEDATGAVGAQGASGAKLSNPVEDTAGSIGARGTKIGTTGTGDGND